MLTEGLGWRPLRHQRPGPVARDDVRHPGKLQQKREREKERRREGENVRKVKMTGRPPPLLLSVAPSLFLSFSLS